MHTYLVTATPPTPNGDLHVGHLSGPYLAADVFARHQRQRGSRAVYLCSSDDHQSYVMTTAARLGRDPEELARHYAEVLQNTLRSADIRLDHFTRALGNAAHVAAVRAFFRALWDAGELVAATRPALRCEPCGRYLFESFAKGRCPHCGEEASGNLCEACGRVNDPVELVEPVCGFCRRPATLGEYTGVFLPLERHRAALAEFYATRATWRPHLRALCEWLTSRPLPDYPVSYPSPWGIRVPVDGFEDHAVNVWFEMYPGHLETTRDWAARAGLDPAAADALWAGGSTVVQFLGYDNSFFNAVLHVALAMASRGRCRPAEHIVTNEFYLLDGEKFSTSRNHAIWGTDILAVVQPDALRWHLARTNPEAAQTDFTFRAFAARTESELAGRWSAAVNHGLALFARAGGRIPAEPEPDLESRGVLGWARQRLEAAYGVERFSLRAAAEALDAYVEGVERYAGRAEHLAGDRFTDRRLGSLGWLLNGLSVFAAPLLPRFSERLRGALGVPAEAGWDDAERPLSRETETGAQREWFARVPVARPVRVAAPAAVPAASAL
jgi:methionyl-tRNA synthetase